MSYVRLWAQQAVLDTKEYWTPLKILLTIIGPIVASLLWVLFKPWNGWAPVMQVAVISLVGMLCLWLIAFMYCFFLAPSRIHNNQKVEHSREIGLLEEAAKTLRGEAEMLASRRDAEIDKIRTSEDRLKLALAIKYPHDIAKEQIIGSILAKLEAHQRGMGRKALEWLLTNGRSDETELSKRFHPNIVQHIDDNSLGHKIIIVTDLSLSTGQFLPRSCEINPEFKLALTNVLHLGDQT